MKKKKIAIDRKMTLGKSFIASLNDAQQQQMVGGVRITQSVTCVCPTLDTSPRPTQPCVLCNTTAI
ncbi:class I lanthipeptide [Chitinophaga sp. 22536]|uniref:class I lanthipeptide n=1 Tax=unclassified Chitinophaga TaxID=2619133 RepID=UPI0031DFBD94